MITRIVKMTFKRGCEQQFTAIFTKYSDKISSADGVQSVRLQQDINQPNIFFTLSEWEDESFLEAYRTSDLFKEVWSQVKPLFEAKAEAWSTTKIN